MYAVEDVIYFYCVYKDSRALKDDPILSIPFRENVIISGAVDLLSPDNSAGTWKEFTKICDGGGDVTTSAPFVAVIGLRSLLPQDLALVGPYKYSEVKSSSRSL